MGGMVIRGKTPIEYAGMACDTMMRKYKAADLPPKGHFHYHQGVFLSGVYKTYQLCGNENYIQYIKDWVDSIINKDGEIYFFSPMVLDDLQPGILLFPLMEKYGEEPYKKALHVLIEILRNFPRNKFGGFGHTARRQYQMWLDGLYMAGPLSAQYACYSGKDKYLDLAAEQALLMREKTEDKETGLWYHAWDSAKEMPWADPDTGLSPEFWGRSIGWVPVAVLDELDFMPRDYEKRPELEKLVKDLLHAVSVFQSKEGRWYQVVNKGDQPGNWLENSCSCLYVAAICKAVRKGILEPEYLEIAQKGYEAVIRSVEKTEDSVLIGQICIGTPVGDYQHYCKRSVSVNDLHGVGAFLLMCTEMQRIAEKNDV